MNKQYFDMFIDEAAKTIDICIDGIERCDAAMDSMSRFDKQYTSHKAKMAESKTRMANDGFDDLCKMFGI